jgi:hypothetical protein
MATPGPGGGRGPAGRPVALSTPILEVWDRGLALPTLGVQAMRLLGAEAIITGIEPSVAPIMSRWVWTWVR